MEPDRLRASISADVAGLSRTVQTGEVDTSSAPEKSRAIGRAEIGVAAAASAIGDALDFLESATAAEASVDWLLELNRLARGEASAGPALRDFGVAQYSYLEPRQIESELADFVTRLRAYDSSADAEGVWDRMFDIHWSVNLRGHYFFDACGRTATILAGWISGRALGRVLPLPRRDDYLSVASAAIPIDRWRELRARNDR